MHSLILLSEAEPVSVSPNRIKAPRSREWHLSAACSSFTSPGGTRESYCHSVSSSCDSSNSVPRPPFLGLRPLSHTVGYRCGHLLCSCFPLAVTGTEILSRCPSALRGSARHLPSSVACLLCSSPSRCQVAGKRILRGKASDDASNRD